MKITIESISKNPNQFEVTFKEDYPYYRGDYLNSHYNIIRGTINDHIDNDMYCLPKDSIWINDVIGFSNAMVKYQKYDCILEIESFLKVPINTNHNYSIRGIWRKGIPAKYLSKYSLFRDQSCIEIGEDIILLSPFNNRWISNILSDGDLTEIIIQSNLNIKYAQQIDT